MRSTIPSDRYARSRHLYERAKRTIPGGIHLSGRPIGAPEVAPMYMERGSGCLVRDVDGNEYVDFVMAFGPFLLGYAHPEVDAAGCEQLRNGSLLSMNHPLHVTYVERIVSRFPSAEMGVFFRTGSEATTAALRIARRATGRRRVVRAGYHGWHDWCLPLETCVPAGLAEQVLEMDATRPESLATLVAAYPGEIAAVILAPEMVLPSDPEVFRRIAAIARAAGAVFILDEIKTAFRIAPGSIQHRYGLTPDMTTLSKALGNGWSIAMVVGTRAVLEHGAGMHFSATFHGDTAAMAASLKALEIIDASEAASHAHALGELLIHGLNEICRRHGVRAHAYGEPLPAMPFLRFEESTEASGALRDAFYAEVFARGVLLHPRHLWFLSRAHTREHVIYALEVADAAMKVALSRRAA